jgi:tRNA pseudouridine32 synthase/23S rRNA pseudouridine746 synthase
VEKVYEALAPSLPALRLPLSHRSRLVEGEPFFRMREAEGEANSETLIESQTVLGAGLSRYRLQPLTGRKHQLRIHLAALGAPIVNDSFYPELRPELEDDYHRPLQLLARAVRFADPLTGLERRFESRRQLDPGAAEPG